MESALNVQVAVIHAQDVCRQHSFGIPLTVNGMHKTQSDHARFELLSRETYAKPSTGARPFYRIDLVRTPWALVNRNLKIRRRRRRRRRKRERHKTIGSISKTTILRVHHAFLYISLPSLHDYDVKMPNFTMYRGNTQATTKFPLSF